MAKMRGRSFLSLPNRLFLSLILLLSSIGNAPAAVTLDGTLGPGGPIAGPAYLIPDTLGSRSGPNLYHSFGQFDIATGESATFTNGGAPLDNVIARVTGGPSSIDGLVRSTIDGASLYLINPAGILFGPDARLDVPGGFHAATADYLKADNGELFHANPALDGVLSMAPPQAFGFLGATPGTITVDRAILQVPAGQTLSLVGGDIMASNDPYSPEYFDYDNFFYGPGYYLLTAPGGRINLAGVASAGELDLASLDTGAFAQLGRITFSDGANITVSSDLYASGPAGTITIRGGEISFRDVGIVGVTAGIEASGNPAGLVDVAGGSLQLDNASIGLFNTWDPKEGDVVRIAMSDAFLMTNGSTIDASNWGWGDAGRIDIRADRIRLGDDDPAGSLYADYGFYGYISSRSEYGGWGRGADIALTGRDITVQNGFSVTTASIADDGWWGPGFGNAGDIIVQADRLQCLDKGQIASNAYGVGNGGDVIIDAREILISDANRTTVANSDFLAGIAATTLDASGGTIRVTADSLQILDGGQINTVLLGSGAGADVEITAASMTVSGFVADSSLEARPYGLSAIDGRVFGADATGAGGDIRITAGQLRLDDGGTIRTGLYSDAPGSAGDIAVTAETIDIAGLGQIYADSFRGSGDSGSILITAGELHISGTGGAPPPAPLDFTFTGLSTTTSSGTGGTITAAITGDLIVDNGGGIKADTQGSGPGGTIDLAARNLVLTDDAIINSSSSGTGDAGNIVIAAADSVLLHGSSITTAASVEADGGNIAITAPELLYLHDSRVTSSVGGGPGTTGGNITIDPRFVVLNNSQIVANAFAGTGGNIDIVADVFLADPFSVVDASSQLGVSGTVDIQAPITGISGLVSPLAAEFTSASALLKERCIARLREGGKYSSFVIGGRDGLPIEPGQLLPTPVF